MSSENDHKAIMDALSEPVADRAAFGIERLGTALQHHAWTAGFAKGLTATQLRVIALLSRAEKTLGTGALASALQLTSPTVSDALVALEKKGWIRRERDGEDRRAVSITLTEEGQQLAESTDSVAQLKSAIESLPPALQIELLRATSATIRGLQLTGAIPPQRMCVTCKYFRPNMHANPRLPHHCAYVNAPFGDAHLRLDCKEQETASDDEQQDNWVRFVAPIINRP